MLDQCLETVMGWWMRPNQLKLNPDEADRGVGEWFSWGVLGRLYVLDGVALQSPAEGADP